MQTTTAGNTEKKPFLVLGGTGKTGRRVVERLTALGHPVRVGSRGAVIPFDWDNRATWAPVLRDVSAVYIAFQPDLAVPGAGDAIREFSALALANGVRRLVLLSGRGEEEAEVCEQILQTSGADWTILRASWFSQNFSENFFVDAIRSGVVALPLGNVTEPFVDVEDIADIAVAALLDDRHIGQLYELTGPRLLTFADAIGEIAQVCGREIIYAEIGLDEYVAAMRQQGIPSEYVDLVTYLFSTVLDGRNSSLTDGVQRALGHPPRDFADYVRDTVVTNVWRV